MGFLRKHVQVSMENVIENSATLIELSCDKKLTIHKQINRQTDKQTNRQTDKRHTDTFSADDFFFTVDHI